MLPNNRSQETVVDIENIRSGDISTQAGTKCVSKNSSEENIDKQRAPTQDTCVKFAVKSTDDASSSPRKNIDEKQNDEKEELALETIRKARHKRRRASRLYRYSMIALSAVVGALVFASLTLGFLISYEFVFLVMQIFTGLSAVSVIGVFLYVAYLKIKHRFAKPEEIE